MIVIDTSAFFSIAADEDERDVFVDILVRQPFSLCSTVTYLESVMVLTGRSQSVRRDRVDDIIRSFNIEVVAVGQGVVETAIAGFDKFGKGRHPARLNFSDCFSYGLAKSRNLPLLFKGDDFAQTDIVPAWRP